jgi:DNA phosphorothioation-associated putative methyltransferase
MIFDPQQFTLIAEYCEKSPLGKKLPNALYIHHSALSSLEPIIQNYEAEGRNLIAPNPPADIIKFNTDHPKISYLYYPDFDDDPHPAIVKSVVVDLVTQEVKNWEYDKRDNPPILHRKETFVTAEYPLYEVFAHLTDCEEKLGLLAQSRLIGTKNQWEKRLSAYHIKFTGHFLSCDLELRRPKVKIERHKAAMVRMDLSRPIKCALELGIFQEGITFFDYGCGYGSDVERMAQKGYESKGWDPHYLPNHSLVEADVVNLGYVINVIENLGERRQALLNAWQLTRQVLIVSAQVLIDDERRGLVAYGDGIITNRNTFQKYYEQEELKVYIDQVLNVDSIPVAIGIYLIFRDEEKAQFFRASFYHSRLKTPRIQRQIRQFEDYQILLTPLIEFVTNRGRLPVKEELPQGGEIKLEFGSYRRAFKLILQATNEEEWAEIEEKRRQDLLLYIALSSFGDRPKFTHLSKEMREDIKALFGTYQRACLLADLTLITLKDLQNIADLCLDSKVGKKTYNSLLIHISALENLEPLLRLYEGTANRVFGRLEDCNIIQLYFHKPQIAYLVVPNFDEEAHPIITQKMTIDLQHQKVFYQEFDLEDNPPIIHEKSAFVLEEYPLFKKFLTLSKQEKERGLLDDYKKIRHLKGWLNVLKENCVEIKGHRLYWRKDCDPYQLKLIKSKISQRKKNYS